MKTFIKWVGGKRSVLPQLVAKMPRNYTKYYEPFVGGGALYFDVCPTRAEIADVNENLIITYQAVKSNPAAVIAETTILMSKHNKTQYLQIRKDFTTELNPVKKASMFIYLNKTCFNGLYRSNKQGQFNVPMGKYKNPPTIDPAHIYNISNQLAATEIKHQSFYNTIVEAGAFYYLDPPYHDTFSSYNSGGFGIKEHNDLAALCKQIDNVGGFFMLSNSNSQFVQQLYAGYKIETIIARRSVSCKAAQRKREQELLIRNY